MRRNDAVRAMRNVMNASGETGSKVVRAGFAPVQYVTRTRTSPSAHTSRFRSMRSACGLASGRELQRDDRQMFATREVADVQFEPGAAAAYRSSCQLCLNATAPAYVTQAIPVPRRCPRVRRRRKKSRWD